MHEQVKPDATINNGAGTDTRVSGHVQDSGCPGHRPDNHGGGLGLSGKDGVFEMIDSTIQIGTDAGRSIARASFIRDKDNVQICMYSTNEVNLVDCRHCPITQLCFASAVAVLKNALKGIAGELIQ